MKLVLRAPAVVTALFAFAANAEPVKLKLSFYTSDRTVTYTSTIKPYVDAVNEAGHGIVQIEPHLSGSLGGPLLAQFDTIASGVADIGYLLPGYIPQHFPDNAVMELPGIFRDMREGTLVYTRLLQKNAMRGYENFVVIGGVSTEPETIHMRTPVASLADLKGKHIRVNNPIEGAALESLGMKATVMPIVQVAEAMGAGKIDGATSPALPLYDAGISRIATYHYMLPVSGIQQLIVMNRKKFESLPKPAQDVLLKFSGEWLAARYLEQREPFETDLLKKLQSDSKRKFVTPSSADRATAETAFKSVTDEWVRKDARNKDLLAAAQAEVTKIRASQ